MNIFRKFWTWLSKPEQVHQPVVEVAQDKCCGQCQPAITMPSDGVAEFYQKDEGYALAVYAEIEDTPVVTTPVPEKKKRKAAPKKPATINTINTKKTVKPVKPTPSKKVPPPRKKPKSKPMA